MADPTPDSNPPRSEALSGFSDKTLAYLVLRFAVAMLLILSGTDKFKSATSPATYNLDNYYGAAADLAEGKEPKMVKIVKVVYENSGLDNEALVGAKTANFFSHVFYQYGRILPWLMLGSGVLILLGVLSRLGLLVGAVVWLSLAIGQLLLPDPETVQMLLFFVLLHAFALVFAKHNRLCLDFPLGAERD